MNVPPIPRQPPTRPKRPPAPPAPAPGRSRWGWLEWFVVSQTAMPALLFLPGASVVRTALRVGAYLVGPIAWAMLASRPRAKNVPAFDDFPARPWLLGCIVWLCLSVFHPNVNSLVTAAGQAALYIAVLSPAFWASKALTEPRQIGRVMAVLFLCNALSATVGVAQAFRPDTFNPPVIPVLSNKYQGADITYVTADGRKIIRPCGLTDTPGSAAPAGAVAALMGLCFALRPGPLWSRAAAAGLAFVGVAVIYFTQIRSLLVMLVICVAVLACLFVYQKRYAQAVQLVVGGALAIGGALAWVARSVGNSVVERFGTLVAGDTGTLYYKSRGAYVDDALNRVLWNHPLGYGMGWWGMIHGSFGDTSKVSDVWVEVMVPAWVYDGGFPLLILYVGAVLAAMYDTVRVALTSRDREVAFWATVVVALNLSILANCLSYITFLSPIGLQFWLLAAVVHAADRQARAGVGTAPTPAKPKPKPSARPTGPRRAYGG